ncbi:hypothetical protein C9I50_07945 [Pseudomonas prosekii]|nr:hypothetical protein C9I50_07945 [Pseudomonas prosekii]
MWRGGLPPLGCEAAPTLTTQIYPLCRVGWFYDCCAADRGQAPSPHKLAPTGFVFSFRQVRPLRQTHLGASAISPTQTPPPPSARATRVR